MMETQDVGSFSACVCQPDKHAMMRDHMGVQQVGDMGGAIEKKHHKDVAEYLDAIIDYAFDAAWRAYERQAEVIPPTAQQKATLATKKAAELQAHAQKVEYIKEQIILLNQEMPNGMRARFCTLGYMFRLGGAFKRIGKEGSTRLVGAVYNEDEYRKKLQGLT